MNWEYWSPAAFPRQTIATLTQYCQAQGHPGMCPHSCFVWDRENISEVNFPLTVLVPADNWQPWGQAGAQLK